MESTKMESTKFEEARTRAHEQHIQVRRITAKTLKATSSDGKGEYTVEIKDASLRCYCWAGLRGRTCKHVAAADEFLTAELRAARHYAQIDRRNVQYLSAWLTDLATGQPQSSHSLATLFAGVQSI